MKELTTQQKVMARILEKCETLENLEKHIDAYAKEYGEEMREFFVATMWDTYHAMNA